MFCRLGVGTHAGNGPRTTGRDFVVPDALGCHGVGCAAAGDDLTAGLEDDLVGGDPGQEIFQLGAEARTLFAAHLADGEVSQYVRTGAATIWLK